MTNEFEGHWITTYTGKKLHYLNPLPEEIDIKDIAHALSLNCRFGGHCKIFYSVAEHSVRVANLVETKYKFRALLHDAAEAYIHDLPRPIKMDLSDYKTLEATLQDSIFLKFGISSDGDEEVKYADYRLLATEARDLMDNTNDWFELPPPLDSKVLPWNWELGEEAFLKFFNGLKCMPNCL